MSFLLFLLSPAKRLHDGRSVPAALRRRARPPQFVEQAAALIAQLRARSAAELAGLMNLSPELVALNLERHAQWSVEHHAGNSLPALRAFAGDVYQAFNAASLTAAELAWADRHLVMLSGLYGLLRPLELMQPYRLEMGSALSGPHGRDLYDYWGDAIAGALDAQLSAERAATIVNLASAEYSRAALRPALRTPVVDCVFQDWSGGDYRVVGLFAKRARGAMARWAVEQRLRSPARLREFSVDGYAFAPAVSTRAKLVFRRRTGD